MDKSTFASPGPYMEFLPTLPKVYAADVANAAGLNHIMAVCVPAPYNGSPVTLARIGFSPSTVPEFAMSPNTEMVKGYPDCTCTMAEVRQSRVISWASFHFEMDGRS